TAIGNDLTTLRQLADERIELVDGGRTSAGDMAGAKLGLGTDVEHNHIATLEPPRELLRRELLHPVSLPQVLVGQDRHLGHMPNCDVADRRPQVRDSVAGEPVDDPRSFPARPYQPCSG